MLNKSRAIRKRSNSFKKEQEFEIGLFTDSATCFMPENSITIVTRDSLKTSHSMVVEKSSARKIDWQYLSPHRCQKFVTVKIIFTGNKEIIVKADDLGRISPTLSGGESRLLTFHINPDNTVCFLKRTTVFYE